MKTKHTRKLTALALALLLTVQGLPFGVFAGAQEDTAQLSGKGTVAAAEDELPANRMRFIETDFNTSTGILTMALQVKPDANGREESISQGMFAFQTDSSTVIPVTRPNDGSKPESILVTNGVAVVHGDGASQVVKDYVASSTGSHPVQRIGTGTFTAAMSATNVHDEDGTVVNVQSNGTAFFVSNQRDNGLLDCYLQYRFEWHNAGDDKRIVPDDGEYVTILKMDFQCYAGGSEKAKNLDALAKGSIRIPRTASEAQGITSQFSYTSGGNTVNVTMGGAGLIQKYVPVDGSMTTGNSYYYYEQPVFTNWHPGVNGWVSGDGHTANLISDLDAEDTAPGLWYPNMDSTYVVTGFTASAANTYAGSKIPNIDADPSDESTRTIDVAQPDFVVPEGESGEYARYDIPTYNRAQTNETADNWTADAHGTGRRQALSYYLSTTTSDNSVSSPETEDLEDFLAGLGWEFAVDDGTSYESLHDGGFLSEAANGKTVTLYDGEEVLVKEATVLEEGTGGTPLNYSTSSGLGRSPAGSKLWTVYKKDSGGAWAYYMTTPMGVVLEMKESQLSYSDSYTDWSDLQSWYADGFVEEQAGERRQLADYSDSIMVQDAVLKDTGTNDAPIPVEGIDLVGGALWNLYRKNGSGDYVYACTTPANVSLGTVMNFLNNQVNSDTQMEYVTTKMLPQLHITSEAANPQNAIWNTAINGQIWFRPIYDPQGAKMTDNYIVVRLYREDSVATYTDLEVGDALPKEGEEGSESLYFWVGRENLDGTGAETPNDGIAAGVAIVSVLYDQYYIAYNDNETLNTLSLVPDAATQTQMTQQGKSEVPFQVDHNEGTDQYTIKYKDGKNANEVVPGVYNIHSYYSDGRSVTVERDIPVTVYKPDDHLAFMDISLSRTSIPTPTEVTEPDGSHGKKYAITYNIPTRTATGESVTTKDTFTFEELANQWRDPTWRTVPGGAQAYDVAKNMRNQFNRLVLSQIVAAGVSVSFTVSYPGGGNTPPRGVTVTNIENGEFSFDNTVLDGSQIVVRVTAEYQGTAVFSEYEITFHRNPQLLNKLSLDSTEIHLTVPTAGSANVTKLINAVGIDQYGSEWNWADLTAAYNPTDGRLNPSHTTYGPWTIVVEGALPAGVVQSSATSDTEHHNSMFTVLAPTSSTSAAENSSFKIHAYYAGVVSDSITVYVERLPSVPTTLASLRYVDPDNGRSPFTSPTLAESDLVLSPVYQVYDQYNSEMKDVNKDFLIKAITDVDSSFTGDINDYIQLDPATGVITVKKAAPNCKVQVNMRAYNTYDKIDVDSPVLTIQRADPVPQSLVITEESLTYPSLNGNESNVTQLTATGETQYGAAQQFNSTGDLVWRLDKAVFADGSEATYPGTISYNSSTNTYSAGTNSVQLTNRGRVTFNNSATLSGVPVSITVTAYASKNSDATETKDIPVNRDPSVATTITVQPNDWFTNGVVQIPDGGASKTTTLSAEVRDQYGITMDVPITWTAVRTWNNSTQTTPAAGAFDLTGNVLTVTDEAMEYDAIIIQASSQGLRSHEIPVSIHREGETPTVTTVAMVGLADANGAAIVGSTGSPVNDVTIHLPAMGEKADGYTDYIIKYAVRDQYTELIYRTVRCEITGIDESIAGLANNSDLIAITNAANGGFRVKFNAAVRDHLKNGTVTVNVKITSVDDNTKFGTGKIRIALEQPAVATYAVGTVTDATEFDKGLPVIPPKGVTHTVTITGQVYDQYGSPMDGNVNLTSVESSDTYSFAQSGDKTGTLTLTSKAPTQIEIRAVPADNPGNKWKQSLLSVNLSRGDAYVDRLAMQETNLNFIYIPVLGSNPSKNVMGEDRKDSIMLRAEVRDQFDSFVYLMARENQVRPLWKFAQEFEGIAFADEMDLTVHLSSQEHGAYTNVSQSSNVINGAILSEEVIVEVTNKALDPDTLEKPVRLELTTNGNDYQDDEFKQNFDLYVRRNPAVPTYLFITDADTNGSLSAAGEGASPQTAIERPSQAEGSVSYQFKPVVYDQYGFAYAEAAIGDNSSPDVDDIVVDLAPFTLDNVEIEKLWANEGDEENGAEPIGYEIYRVRYEEVTIEPEDGGEPETSYEQTEHVLMASFDRLTGVFTVTSECDLLEQVTLKATYEPLGSVGTKSLLVPIHSGDPYPASVTLERSHGDYTLSASDSEAPPDVVTPVVLDQYGKRYTGSFQTVWTLYMPQSNAAGEYVTEYTERDETGAALSPQDYLIQKVDNARTNTTEIQVYPANYLEDRSAALRCMVRSSAGDAVFGYATISVTKKSGRVTPVVVDYTVTFDAGEYGTVAESSVITVEAGEKVPVTPGVTTVEGYGFLGWTQDGETLADVTSIPIFKDTTFAAVYKDISKTKFMEGYSDETVRPNAAVTRAEFTTMVVRALGGYDPNRDYGETFPDVPAGRWYTNYIAYAKSRGVVNGYPDGNFRPDDEITRAEAAKVLAYGAGLKLNGLSQFPDVPDGKWYSGSVAALYDAGVVSGFPDGTFGPVKDISRGETAKIVVSLTDNNPTPEQLANITKNAECPFSDITERHWAYAYILRAAGIA